MPVLHATEVDLPVHPAACSSTGAHGRLA
ncbi:hypothetical protein [Streptomyces sp. NPDC127105]